MYRSIAESISRKISGIRACEMMRTMPKSSAMSATIRCAKGSAQQRATGGMLSHSIEKQAMNWHINKSLNGRVAVPSATADVPDGGGTPSLPGAGYGRVAVPSATVVRNETEAR